MEISRGRWVSKAHFFKGKYDTKMSTKPSVEGVWIFSGTAH